MTYLDISVIGQHSENSLMSLLVVGRPLCVVTSLLSNEANLAVRMLRQIYSDIRFLFLQTSDADNSFFGTFTEAGSSGSFVR